MEHPLGKARHVILSFLFGAERFAASLDLSSVELASYERVVMLWEPNSDQGFDTLLVVRAKLRR
jgi:hypothetical protein